MAIAPTVNLSYMPGTGPPQAMLRGWAGEVRVDTPHPDYERYAPVWKRIRDCINGEDQVKLEATRYLPLLQDMDPIEYERYKRRAKFCPFTRATVEMLSGFIFRKDPEVAMPDELEAFDLDCTMGGKDWYQFCKETVEASCSVGRSGTLIDWSKDEGGRPYLSPYSAEQILNWKTTRVGTRMELALLVLQEQVEVNDLETGPDIFSHEAKVQYRVYRLDSPKSEAPSVVCELYDKDSQGKFRLTEQTVPNRRGEPLDRIPFVFHGSQDTDADIDTPPMTDISGLNIKHYTTSADLENGRHFCGLPTPYAICFDVKSADQLKIGSSIVWVSENEKAHTGYLEFRGDGLKTLEAGIVETEEQLAALGARMLEKQKGDEAYQTVLMRQSGQSAALIKTAEACSDSLSSVLKWALWWTGTQKNPEEIDDDEAGVVLNTDFVEVKLQRGEALEMAQITQMGMISRQTFHEWAQRAELIPADRDFDEEQEMIAQNPPPGLPAFQKPTQQQPSNGSTAGGGNGTTGSGTAEGTVSQTAKSGRGVPRGSDGQQGGAIVSYQNR